MNILGTGLSGLVGTRITELLPEHTYENLSLETGVDITDKRKVDDYFSHSDAPWVFHLAAFTDVQGAEKERDLKENSISWKVNVLATEYIAENCRRYRKKLLYLDTDYAFDGTKKTYSEDDIPNPLGWYAKTKYDGARKVLELDADGLVLRISNPYRAFPVGKKDFAHKMLERLLAGQPISAPADQLFVPTFIDDLALSVRALLAVNAGGMYHVVGSGPLSPYDAAMTIAGEFGLDTSLVKKTAFADMFRDRAPVPQFAALKNDKIQALGIRMKSFKEGIAEVKKQEEQFKKS